MGMTKRQGGIPAAGETKRKKMGGCGGAIAPPLWSVLGTVNSFHKSIPTRPREGCEKEHPRTGAHRCDGLRLHAQGYGRGPKLQFSWVPPAGYFWPFTKKCSDEPIGRLHKP